MERKQITQIVLVSLFTALTAAGAFIRIPLPPVPITLQTLFAMLAATVLPPAMATLSIVVYLLLGIIGLPIFTAGSGLGALLSPTGGYLIGMVPAVFLGSLIMKLLHKGNRIQSFSAAVSATLIIYIVGLWWLSESMDLSLTATLSAGLLPFIPGDILKIIVTAAVAPSVRKRINDLLETR